MQLKQGTLLQKGKYKIEKCLGQGSFGITYLAKTKLTISGGKGKTSTWVDVAIKEFFMKDFNCRQPDGSLNESSSSTIVEKYKKDFKKEADNLAKMEHPGIVDILDSFEENNTCYLVMAYIDGKSLDAYIADKGAIPENEGLQYIEKIADALHYMHCQHMLHLDLKPKNIMRNKENDTFIIDFGLSKQYDENDEPESSTTLGQGTQGYAPIEQGVPHSGHDFPVTIDVYALGATFYKILTGKTPPYAASILSTPDILKKNLESKNVSNRLTQTIIKAMNPRKEDRYKCVADFMKSLGLKVHEYPRVIKELEVTVVHKDENSSEELQIERDNGFNLVEKIGKAIDRIISHIAFLAGYKDKFLKGKTVWSFMLGFVLIVILGFILNINRNDNNTQNFDIETSDSIADCIHREPTIVNNNSQIPNDFVLIPSGILKHYGDDYDSNDNIIFKDIEIDSFYICNHEVTQMEYNRVMGANPSYFKGDSLPVNNLGFRDAIIYCNKRSQLEGYKGFYTIEGNIVNIDHNANGYRLPTQYEWAFASRAEDGTKTAYAGGNNLREIAWYGGNSQNKVHTIATKKPNARGIYDLNGNVSELIWMKCTFGKYNCSLGSSYSLYIMFEEGAITNAGGYDQGLRVVLVPSHNKNRNTKSVNSIRIYKQE